MRRSAPSGEHHDGSRCATRTRCVRRHRGVRRAVGRLVSEHGGARQSRHATRSTAWRRQSVDGGQPGRRAGRTAPSTSPRLYEVFRTLDPDDWVHLTDWEGDPDELLAGPGTAVGDVLAGLARRGVHVRGLLWRSHPRQAHFSEQENTKLVREINEAGGEILLDERVRRGGSHHQKLVVIRRAPGPDDDIAFVGGIDLCHGRRDDGRHEGDPQAVDLNPRYGDRPPWHDIQLQLCGPAVGDVAYTFRERWEDPTPFDHRNPLRVALRRLTRQPRRPDPLPPAHSDPAPAGPHAVRSSARTAPSVRATRSRPRASAASAVRTARRSVGHAGSSTSRTSTSGRSTGRDAMADALRREPDLRLIAVVPRFAERGGLSAHAENIGRYASSKRCAPQAVTASPCTTWRTFTARLSTSTPRSA